MVTFEVTSTQECTIDGIGFLKPGETKTLDKVQLAHFKAIHGYPVGSANFPQFVSLVAVSVDDEEGKEV